MSKLSRSQAIAKTLHIQAEILGSTVAIMWVTELIDLFVMRGRLDRFGIYPLQLSGLWGILWAPFLHHGLGHLIANTIPFVILGWLVMLQETYDFFIVAAISMFVGGLGTWLFGGANTIHLGASGVVFGFLGFLLSRGFFQRNLPSILLSLIVGLTYGGLLWGVLPLQPGISWQGHLFGFIGGAIAARLIAKADTSENL